MLVLTGYIYRYKVNLEHVDIITGVISILYVPQLKLLYPLLLCYVLARYPTSAPLYTAKMYL